MKFILLLIINVISFFLFWIDKRRATKNKYRISEFILLLSCFLGGIFGAILAIMIFKHKISKISFKIKLGVIILIQIGILYLYFQFLSPK